MVKKIVFFVLCVGILLYGGYKYFFKSWTPYYQEKLYKEPRPLLIKAVELSDNAASDGKNALDLGAGAGNDTAYLLKHGWHVWANDAQREALEIIASRTDIEPYKSNVILLHKNFIELPWLDFPSFNLIYAGYSLPFASPAEFAKIWHALVQALPSGALFAGNFFGSEHGAFNWWVKRNMTFLTKEQLLALFVDFKIEFLQEFHEKNESGLFDHSFNVIARKL